MGRILSTEPTNDIKLTSDERLGRAGAPMVEISFLGTGNAFCPPDRLHSLVLIDGSILVDAPPTVVPQLRRVGGSPAQITDLLITHWHGDHTFGLPFLLLERKYISDREGGRDLTIHCHRGGEERLRHLCDLAYPGSLEDLEWLSFNEDEGRVGQWSFQRFEVCHDPATEPHGYRFVHDEGFVLVHCGDSGPCANIEALAGEADVMIIELGIPDHVDSPYHYTPSRVRALAESHPDTIFLATHHYADGAEGSGGFERPELPANVIQAEDGDRFVY